MPCWYFEKKEIKNSPSYRDGLDTPTEARYRREGARFIVEAGTKLGLRFDTCATGVVYFHRFYMFHSFKEFPRHVTAACCLFLAGKVEETPKKCKDIIKIAKELLKPKQFSVFGNDPKEEVMTVERVLLQTIKFDLQTSHPYAFLLKFAKLIKGDKEKTQKLVQMAWTFINDSLCTTLSLQWEPEIIAISLMYLGTRLNKFEVSDWVGKVPGTKTKWWESIVEDITVDLMEDVCHQVLDLYSPANQASALDGESPPPPPPQHPGSASRTPNSQGSGDRKRSSQSTPSDPVTPGSQSNKSLKIDSQNRRSTPQKKPDKGSDHAPPSRSSSKGHPSKGQDQSQPKVAVQSIPVPTSAPPSSVGQEGYPPAAAGGPPPPASAYSQAPPTSAHYPPTGSTTDFTQYNPYVSANQFGSSFMSTEGLQNIQNMMGSGGQQQQQQVATSQAQVQPAQPPQYAGYPQPPPPVPTAPPPVAGPGVPQQYPGMPPGAAPGQYPPGYNPAQYPSSAAVPGPPVQQPYGQQPAQPPPQQQQFQGTAYPQYPPYSNYQQPPPPQAQGYDQKAPAQPPQHYQGGGAYPGNQSQPRPRHAPPPPQHHNRQQPPPRQGSSALTTVRITGR